jgi:Ca2+-binding EF-hand superfamily protein
MFFEEKILQENILSKEHIDELYILFSTLCDSEKYSIIPSNFIQVFNTIAEKKGLTLDKDIWNGIFFQIDYDKDGQISFQDILRYIYNNIKLILVSDSRSSYNRMK